jgi:DNA repair photolyase
MEPPGDFINCPERSKISGTREWAVAEINCCLGCPHGCRYCYARYDQVLRRKLVPVEQWQMSRIVPEEVKRTHPLYPGQVMFPAAHDIVPENLEACCSVLSNLLAAGNRVLVVSKPQKACIEELCRRLAYARDRILFRFTITARDKALLNFWEPYAPAYEERLLCLAMARDRGFSTSVSVEPILDSIDVVAMVHELLPLISHSIWLGKMNKVAERVAVESPQVAEMVAAVEAGQADEEIFRLYEELSHLPKVRWKESIKAVVGLPLAEEPGLDR